jgi:5'-nucleotidase (lipoprotein e(P4) family)
MNRKKIISLLSALTFLFSAGAAAAPEAKEPLPPRRGYSKVEVKKENETPALAAAVLTKNVTPAIKAQDTAAAQEESAKQLAAQNTGALLWMRTSSEYRALCYQGYNAAMAQIDKALADRHDQDKKLAIVLDCDETVLDNTSLMGQAVKQGNGFFTSLWWCRAVHEGASAAMPGAVEFLQKVHDKGVDIFYVTNRYEPINYDATIRNLIRLGFPDADQKHVLLFNKNPNKQPRYDEISKNYHIILYMGDSATDFPLGLDGKNMEERNRVIDAHAKEIGSRFIFFPNPAYGSWITAIDKDYMRYDPEERDAVNQEYL